ncbi:cytohesin-interacting protein isoform X2 [Nerophis ophidion]|uniref:cytohesin-interacting protein isoform X2 n=1 Tax=Nerophis ophidion TaxID=159077 RepID=UPI002ADF8253|nr:cytohesin-interacting protein isoform X2 [Nerophis ophidion]
MNPGGRPPPKAGVERNPAEPSPGKRTSLWYRRSLRGSNDQQRQRYNCDSLPRTVKTHGLQLRSSSAVEACTFVSRVEDSSAAESAGLTAGDVIISINGASIEGRSHQHIADLIRESTNRLKMETVCGSVVKWIELEKRVKMLKQSLREKLVELQALTLQEQGLLQGHPKENNLSTDSSEVPADFLSLRFSSDSSCRSGLTDDSDQGSVFGDPSSPSPCSAASGSQEEHFFSRKFSVTSGNHSQHIAGHSSSSSLASSSNSSLSSQSPTWNETRIFSLFGTLPRKGRRTNVRKNILKLIPGLQQGSVEEEEP